MELDVSIEKDSLSINIENPFKADIENISAQIETFLGSKEVNHSNIDLRGLIPKMIRGIAGCENGCPSNAKGFVSQGFKNFALDYIEGGILSAKATSECGKTIELKMFPEF